MLEAITIGVAIVIASLVASFHEADKPARAITPTTKFRHLDEALVFLYNNGKEDDFTANGLPKLNSVKKIYDGAVDRKYVDRCWRQLYGFQTSRESILP